MFPVEPVTILRTSQTIYALIDPSESRIYVKSAADVVRGDVLTFRGLTRRVHEDPELWAKSSLVIPFEDAPPFLPDLGTLHRQTPGGFDRATQTYLQPGLNPIWTGPCSLKPESVLGADADVAEQQVTVQPFAVTVPLDLVDVQPDDVFEVTASRDTWLTGRPLTVVRVEGGSEELGRIIRVTANQG
ncbi:hypothetical protein GCM10009616_35790 [Microlunatus lacustris]